MPRRCVLCADEHWGDHEYFCNRCIDKTGSTQDTRRCDHSQPKQKDVGSSRR